ncbi:MAG: hypothetical protein EOP53_03435 [Sphingobacteriales bacterium]|nr:MAG: hypothetical protein EOP53_03435 [Sphingobacteriales bacterium]
MAGPLPVNFVSITAQRQADRSIAVNWKVANEINIVKYEVERSANGLQFNAILSRDAQHLSSYSKTDISPLAADNFYRIKAIGLAGDITYSDIVKVAPDKLVTSIVVTQMPVKNKQLHLRFTQQPAGNYDVQLTNAIGQLVYQGRVAVNGLVETMQVNLPATTAAGTYQLGIRNKNGEFVHGESIMVE